MNTFKSTLVVAALICASTTAFANEGSENDSAHPHGHGHHGMMHSQMKSMDTNNDGLISKSEFMKAHEARWNELPKNAQGEVSIADMEKARQERRQRRHAERHEKMMKDHAQMMQEHEKMMDDADADTDDDAKEQKPAS